MSCPFYEYRDTGWFSYNCVCRVTGAVIGNENNHTKVDYLCNADYSTCPLYQSQRR